MIKIIEINFEGINYTIQYKDDEPIETIVIDETGKQYHRKARALLKEKTKQLEINNDKYFSFPNGKEYNTNNYFNKIYGYIKHLNNRKTQELINSNKKEDFIEIPEAIENYNHILEKLLT